MNPKHNAEYFDGTSAIGHLCYVRLVRDTLVIAQNGQPNIEWPVSNVELVSGNKPGQALRLKLKGDIGGSRLTIAEGDDADHIREGAPSILSRYSTRNLRGIAISLAVIAGIGIAGYGAVSIAPRMLASFIPEKVINNFSDGLEKSLIKSAKQCDSAAGTAAMNAIARRIAAGDDDPPTFSIRVYDIRQGNKKKLVNAFALPGGRIVFSSGLIEQAESADEVAGVLAHELGHVALKHPEAAIVRVYGMQIILSIFTGGQGSQTIGSIAGLLTLLRYSRAAEEEADAYATKVLENTKVDPQGLRAFFTRLLKKKTGNKSSKTNDTAKAGDSSDLSKTVEPFTELFSTHPGTQDRLAKIKPLDGGTNPPLITEAEWQALKNICK